MQKVGIDKIALYSPHYALDLKNLAAARGTLVDKYHQGLGQYVMAVPPPGEDIVTMAANACQRLLAGVDTSSIELVLFATESGIDQSKAAGLYVHELLQLPARCRIVELKQACYSATVALQLALPFLQLNPHKKVLLIASDIARYGLGTPGESSQGAGAVAMLLSVNPRLLAIEPDYGVITENVMDFWRPNYMQEALVEGKYSSKLYLSMLEKTWQQYQAATKREIKDHAYFCYHTPVPRLVEKAHHQLLKINGEQLAPEIIAKQIQGALRYGRQIGNSYTASLYIGFASLLDEHDDLANQRIGFYSYGSGCVAEFFSGIVQPGYQKIMQKNHHRQQLATRKMLSFDEYCAFYSFQYPQDGSEFAVPHHYATGAFRLAGMHQHKRIYETVSLGLEIAL